MFFIFSGHPVALRLSFGHVAPRAEQPHASRAAVTLRRPAVPPAGAAAGLRGLGRAGPMLAVVTPRAWLMRRRRRPQRRCYAADGPAGQG